MTEPIQKSPVQTVWRQTVITPSGQVSLIHALRVGTSEGCSLLSEHVVFMGVAGRSTKGQQWIDGGPARRGTRQPGVVDVVPAGHRLHGWSGGAGCVTYVAAQLAPGLAAEEQARGRLEAASIRPALGSTNALLQGTMAKMPAAFDMPEPERQLYSEALLRLLSLELLALQKTAADGRARGGLAPAQLRRTCEAMEASLQSGISLAALATQAGCSPTHLSRAFKQSTGLSPFAWLLERRVERAKRLLANPTIPLAEVALATGFSAQPQFTTAFRRITGTTPGAWRRNL